MDRETLRAITRLLEPIKRKVQLIATKVVLELVKDSTGIQSAQISGLADEVDDDVEHMQPGGLTHVAPAGAEGVLLAIAGEQDDGVVICLSKRGRRPKGLAVGDTCLYSDSDTQAKIHVKADGNIEITAPGGTVTVNGDLVCTGEVTAMSGPSQVSLSTHLHGHPMGPTSAPTPGT